MRVEQKLDTTKHCMGDIMAYYNIEIKYLDDDGNVYYEVYDAVLAPDAAYALHRVLEVFGKAHAHAGYILNECTIKFKNMC